MKKNYLIICFLFALFLGLGAKDMAVSAATRKVIVEQPTEPGTHLDVGYKNPGSFFPIMIDREAMVEVGTTLQIGVTSSGGAPLVAVRVNGEALPGSGNSYSYVIPEGEGDIVITAEFGSLFKLSFSSSYRMLCQRHGYSVEERYPLGTQYRDNGEDIAQFELRTGFFPREQGRESVRGARKRLQFCVDERCND